MSTEGPSSPTPQSKSFVFGISDAFNQFSVPNATPLKSAKYVFQNLLHLWIQNFALLNVDLQTEALIILLKI